MRQNLLKYVVNEKFFDKWSSQMAYILGFTYADGNIYKNTLAWDVQIRDIDILRKIKTSLNSTYPISNRTHSVRLRINNQQLIKGAIRAGLLPKKKMRGKLPQIPKYLLKHFIRGYLEGDGWLVVRSDRNEIDLGFANGSRAFLVMLNRLIQKILAIHSGRVRKKVKVTPRGVLSTTYQLEFYSSNAVRIAKWLYEDLEKNDLCLDRKYKKFLRAKKVYDFLESGTKKVRVIQLRFGKPMREILDNLYSKQKLDGVRIASFLGVHSSSVYRWLAKTGIKYPVRRNKLIYG